MTKYDDILGRRFYSYTLALPLAVSGSPWVTYGWYRGLCKGGRTAFIGSRVFTRGQGTTVFIYKFAVPTCIYIYLYIFKLLPILPSLSVRAITVQFIRSFHSPEEFYKVYLHTTHDNAGRVSVIQAWRPLFNGHKGWRVFLVETGLATSTLQG